MWTSSLSCAHCVVCECRDLDIDREEQSALTNKRFMTPRVRRWVPIAPSVHDKPCDGHVFAVS